MQLSTSPSIVDLGNELDEQIGKKVALSVDEIQTLLRNELGLVADGLDHLALQLDTASLRNDSILLVGETGVGKNLAARAVHILQQAHGFDVKMSEINCAEINPNLIESELFGHKRGAYTGAHKDHIGIIESSTGGVLFLDEVGELSSDVQAKLLRVIEEQKVRPVGSITSKNVNIQIIAATSPERTIHDERAGLRQDLYFRLASTRIDIPSFRSRTPEHRVALIQDAFRTAPEVIRGNANAIRMNVDHNVIDFLSTLSFPGNIRQLKSVAQAIFVQAYYNAMQRNANAQTVISVSMNHLTPEIMASVQEETPSVEDLLKNIWEEYPDTSLPEAMETTERSLITYIFSVHNGETVSGLARILGINRNTLYQKIKKYGLKV